MSNKKIKTLSQVSKGASNFSGKKGDGFDGTGYFPNKNLERGNTVEQKRKMRASRISHNSKKFKSTYEDNHKGGKMSMVPEKMVKHKRDKDSGRISSNPKFINPDNIMRYIEESNMTISKQKITNIIRSEIKAAMNELSVNDNTMMQEKTRGPAAPVGPTAASSVSKGGFAIKGKSSVRGDTVGGTRTSAGGSDSGRGGRGVLASKGRASVASAISAAASSRLADFQAAKSAGGRNATAGRISAGYIANKAGAISKYNGIVNTKINTLTTARNSYNSGTVMYVALNNLINQLNSKKTEYSAKWDFAQALYDDNSSAKASARTAIMAARTSRRAEPPVGSDPPPPPATPNHKQGDFRAGVKSWDKGGIRDVQGRWRDTNSMMRELYGGSNNVAVTGWDSASAAGGYTVDGSSGRDNWNANVASAGKVFGKATSESLLNGLDGLYGNKVGTAYGQAVANGWNRQDSSFVWFVGQIS